MRLQKINIFSTVSVLALVIFSGCALTRNTLKNEGVSKDHYLIEDFNFFGEVARGNLKVKEKNQLLFLSSPFELHRSYPKIDSLRVTNDLNQPIDYENLEANQNQTKILLPDLGEIQKIDFEYQIRNLITISGQENSFELLPLPQKREGRIKNLKIVLDFEKPLRDPKLTVFQGEKKSFQYYFPGEDQILVTAKNVYPGEELKINLRWFSD